MAAWIVTALALLARVAPRARALARRIPGGALPLAGGIALGNIGIPGVDLFPDGAGPGVIGPGVRRRRRRRALTASDRADIAFIESILGKSAGKSFAMIIATRT